MAKKAQQPAQKQAAQKAGFTPILLALVFVGTLLTSLPTIILATVGMLPTGVAFIIDRTLHKQNTVAVGALNFAGLWPYLWMLWMGDHSISNAMTLLSDVFAWLVIYGAASFGWIIFIMLPPIVVQVLRVLAEKRVETLRENQKKIIEEWGKEVAEVQVPAKGKGKSKNTVETVEPANAQQEAGQATAPLPAEKAAPPAA